MNIVAVVLFSIPYITWPQFHGERENVGIQLLNGGITQASLFLKWETPVGAGTWRNGVAIEDTDGDGQVEVVGCVSENSTVFCLDGLTGAVEWSTVLSGTINNDYPAVGDLVPLNGANEVVVRNDGGTVYCLNGATGATIWTFTGAAPGGYGGPVTIADVVPTTPGPEVIWGDGAGNLRCLQGDNGAVLWTYAASGLMQGAAVGELDSTNNTLEVVVSSNSPGTIHCVRGDNGAVIWTAGIGGNCRSTPAIGDLVQANGTEEVVVSSESPGVLCYRGDNGALLWTHAHPYTYNASPAIGDINGDGNLDVAIATCTGSALRAINGATGALLWSFNLGACTGGASVAICDIDSDGDNEVFSPSDNGWLYCVGPTGVQEWSYQFAPSPWLDASPSIGDIDNDSCAEVVMQGERSSRILALDGTDPCTPPVGVGAEETVKSEWVRLTPLGLSGSISIVLTEPANLRIYSADGRAVVQGAFLPPGRNVVQNRLPAGVYMVELVTPSGKRASAKFVMR